MKLATLPATSPDGRLVVVSRDLARCVPADDIAPTLLDAIQRWEDVAPTLEDRFERLQSGDSDGSVQFDQAVALAPLPRTPQWLDGSVFQTHLDLMAQALHPERPNAPSEFPFIYQGASDDLRGPTDPIAGYHLDEGIDFEGEFGVVVDDVPMRVTADDALGARAAADAHQRCQPPQVRRSRRSPSGSAFSTPSRRPRSRRSW